METLERTEEQVAPKIATLTIHKDTCTQDALYPLQACTPIDALAVGSTLGVTLQHLTLAGPTELQILTANETKALCVLEERDGLSRYFEIKSKKHTFKLKNVPCRDGSTREFPSAEFVINQVFDKAAYELKLAEVSKKRAIIGKEVQQG